MRGCSSIASNTGAANLRPKTLKAYRFCFPPGAAKRQASRGSGRGAAATMRGRSSIAPNTGAANLQRKNAKSGQVLVRTWEDKTESIDYCEGVCQSSDLTCYKQQKVGSWCRKKFVSPG